MSRRPVTSLSPQEYHRRLEGQSRVRRELHGELLSLPVPAFDRLVARLLEALGYRDVRLLGEGRGGADLIACAPGGLCCALTLIQAKQYAEPVSRRFVDELRGAMLRLEASQGLLITSSSFYGPALSAAAQGPLRVCLVGGEELASLLIRHGLGVRACGGALALDREFLATLAQAPCEAPAPTQAPAR